MNTDSPNHEEPPLSDTNGVDRSLIREMLDLTPAERLRRLEGFVASILAIRELNAGRSAIP